jgi:hypothetical protein
LLYYAVCLIIVRLLLSRGAMKTIVLISCVSKKLQHKAKAKDLYLSSLFELNLAYAQKLKPDAIYILSAKCGLLDLETEIEPYDVTLNNMSAVQIKIWAQMVLRQLRERTDVERDHFIFLAGDNYRKYLIPHLASYNMPLEGLTIGRQLQRLNQLLHE